MRSSKKNAGPVERMTTKKLEDKDETRKEGRDDRWREMMVENN